MAWCLIPAEADKFLKGLQDGSIDPEKLNDMSSAERHKFFAEKFGGDQNASEINSLFESKLLLKDVQAGMVRWAKKIGGLNPASEADILSKISKMDKILNPDDLKSFKQDLVNKKLGTEVTIEEAKQISEAVNKVNDLKIQVEQGKATVREYGIAKGEFFDLMEKLNPTNNSLIASVANLPRTIQTIGDLGWFGRQGWGMSSRPELYKGLFKGVQAGVSEKAALNLRGDILGDPDYKLVEGKLRLPLITHKISEKDPEFMSVFPTKIPGVKQIERANAGLATYTRWSVAKRMINDARKTGEDVSKGSDTIKQIINSVNSFTGSGNLGKNDKFSNLAPVLNPFIYSARGISAKTYMLNPMNYFDPKISSTVRKANIRNLLGAVGITLATLAVSKAMGSNVETDPRSSNFGKRINGKMHTDETGGLGPFIVFLARMATNQTKTGNKVVSLDKGYKSKMRSGLALDFGRNKLAPLGGLIVDWMAGPIAYQDSSVTKAILGPAKKKEGFNVTREAINKTAPMIIDTVFSMANEPISHWVIGSTSDFLGKSTSSY